MLPCLNFLFNIFEGGFMRNFIITLMLLLVNFLIAFSFEQNEFAENLEVNRVGVNFNGSVSNGSSILVYGDGGIILRSIDGGTTWNKIVIADTLDIIGIISQGFLYLGLTSHRWGILSMDNGVNWSLVDIGDYNFYQLLPYQGNVVALTENKVLILHTSLNKIKEYTYNTDANYYKATISGNNIFCSSGYGKITVLNLENDNQKVLSLSDLGICSDCPVVQNLIADSKGNVFFALDRYLFVLDTKNSTVDTVALLQKRVDVSALNVFNDTIYYIYARQFATPKDSLFFHRINPKNGQYTRVNIGETEGYISNLSFTHLNFLKNDKVIAVGKNHLIYLSNDGGVHWELKSFLGRYDYVNLFESKELRAIGPYSTFFYSSNFGTTWLPTRSYYNEFNNPNFYIIKNSRGFVFFKDKNNGVCFYPTSYSNEKNASYTTDGGNILKIKNLTEKLSGDLETFALEFENKYLFFQWGCLPWNLGCWSSFRLLNDTLGIEWDNAIRGTQMFYATKYNDRIYSIAKDSSEPNDVYSIYFTQDKGNNWIKDFTFKIAPSERLDCDNAIFIESENSIFATWSKIFKTTNDTFSVQSCYKIDLKHKKAQKIIETRGLSTPYFVKIKDKYFFTTADLIFQNNKLSIIDKMFVTDDINTDNIVWDTVKFKRFSVANINNVIGDSIIIFTVVDKLTNNSSLYSAKVKSVSDVKDVVEIEPINSIYISQPIPNPARDLVKFNVYWDQRYDIEHSEIKVYNVLGEIVSTESDFEIIKKNNYSGELQWKIGALPSGVYYVIITNGIHHSTAKVVVN